MVSPLKLMSLLGLFFLTITACINSQPETSQMSPSPRYKVADKPKVLATIRDDEQPPVMTPAAGSALHSPVDFLSVTFASHGGGVAYTVGQANQICVVHNGRAGRFYNAIGNVVLSSDGSRVAYAALIDEKWCMVVDGMAGEPFSIVKDPKFSPDGKHLAYQGMQGDMWHLVVDKVINTGTKKRYRPHEFSGDSANILFIDNFDDSSRKGRLIISDIFFKNERIVDTGVSEMIINTERTAVAAISKSDSKRESVIQINISKPEQVSKGAEFDKVIDLAFAHTGTAMTYIGERAKTKYAVLSGREEIIKEGQTVGTPVINQAGSTVGVLMSDKSGSFLYQLFRNSGRSANSYDEAEGLIYSSDGGMSAFAARKGKSWFIVLNGADGPAYDRVVSPKFSPDGKYLVYRARKDGKRFVIVADSSGKVLRQLPSYEQVFDVQFTADGKSVAYGVKDGKQLAWKVERL